MRDDIRTALRALASARTFSCVALLVLTLGIGATTAIFSVVDAVVLRGLPFDEHDRLVAVGERRPPNPDFADTTADPDALSSASPQNYLDWAARQQVFESIAAIAGGMFVLREPGSDPEELRGQRVTASFFDVLRERPRLGRAFTTANEVEGRHAVVVLSHGLWTRRFGGDPDIVGKAIAIEGGPYEVAGVMAADFDYPVGAVQPTDIWVPYFVPERDRIRDPQGRSSYLQTIARLEPGVSIEQARANMEQIASALMREHPVWNKDIMIGVRPLHDHIVGARTARWMLLLLGTVTFVLLIACANVANLMLARATARQREIGIRAALGAERWRLMRQLLVESVVLAMIGTAFAVVLATWSVGVLKNAMPDGVPRVAAIAVDLRVLGAAAALSLMTGLLFGIVPAVQLSRPDLVNALKEGTRSSSGVAGKHLRSALVVVEMALAVILLVGAALFIGSFRELMKIDPGLDAGNVLAMQIVPRLELNPLAADGGGPPDQGPALHDFVERLRQIPGVLDAAATSGMPFGGSMTVMGLTVPGRELPLSNRTISLRRVTPDYHKTLRIPLREGRYFEPGDRAGTAPVAILAESAAKALFPGESAIGKSITITRNGSPTVVGVVGDVYQRNLETEPRIEAYLPMAQQRTFFAELLVKTTGHPPDVVPALRTAAAAAMPGVLLRNIRTMDDVLSRLTAQRRLNMLLLGLFGLLGLVLSAVGVYGVMTYVVSQRTREIGVRMALGATRRSVLAMILRNATMLVASGLVIGGAAAWMLRQTADGFLFRTDVDDPRVFLAALGTLAVAALVASVIPARRAASVDPTVALRVE